MSEATELSEKRRRKTIHYNTALESFKVELKDFEGNKKDKILELAKLLEETGHPKENISEKVGDDLSGYLSRRYVREVLGDEYKDKKWVRNQAQTVPSDVSDGGTTSAVDTEDENKIKQPIAITNTGSQEIDSIYGKSKEQMRQEADEEIREDKEGTLENPSNMLKQTPNPAKEPLLSKEAMISDTSPDLRDMSARISELEEALRIQKEEAETKGKKYFELKRKYLQNAPENLQRENMELKRMLNNLKTLHEESNESVKEELGYKEFEIFKLNTERVSWILQTSKSSERTLFLVVNPKTKEIVEVKTDKEMHRIQSRRRQEAELLQEAAKEQEVRVKQ